jgi:hypothetical protein
MHVELRQILGLATLRLTFSERRGMVLWDRLRRDWEQEVISATEVGSGKVRCVLIVRGRGRSQGPESLAP